MIRTEAGMSTARFCRLIDMPERTWRRYQARARDGMPTKGPWPMPVAEAVEPVVVKHAEAHTAWGHRKVWAMTRFDGHQVSPSTVLRVMRRRNLLQPQDYQRERRQLAAARKAAFCDPPTGPNEVWQLDLSEFETSRGGTWRLAGCADYWSKYEFGWHQSLTGNQHDAIAAVELALAEAETLAGTSLPEALADPTTGEIVPINLDEMPRCNKGKSHGAGENVDTDGFSVPTGKRLVVEFFSASATVRMARPRCWAPTRFDTGLGSSIPIVSQAVGNGNRQFLGAEVVVDFAAAGPTSSF